MKLYNSHTSSIIIGLLSIFILVSVYISSHKATTGKQVFLINELVNNYQPSINALSSLNSYYEELIKLTKYWSFSSPGNDSLFRSEFHNIFHEKIHPVTAELLILSDKWDEADVLLIKEITDLTRKALFNNLLTIVEESIRYKSEQEIFSEDIRQLLEEGEIIFLMSEMEQNLNYLIDKKNMETSEILRISKSYSRKIQNNTYYFSLTVILIIAGLLYLNYRYTRNVKTTLFNRLKQMSEGIIPLPVSIKGNDSLNKLYQQMNKFIRYISDLVILSHKILNKDFSESFIPSGNEDKLGNALADIQMNIKIASEEEIKRKKEDYERNWVSEGIARINDILRISGDKIEDLSNELVKEIVNYTGSKLGVMFVVNNEERSDLFLEMIAAYAYNREKHIEKRVSFGEGLVGRCALEKESIYLTEIPDKYLSIKSGLGEDNPASILLVPLKIADTVYGVFELASFNEFETYQIRFIETIGINIATTISKVKINQKTSLLLEQTRQQAEEMSTQEEEMRQSMEELRATQEQSALREEKLKKEIEELRARLNK